MGGSLLRLLVMDHMAVRPSSRHLSVVTVLVCVVTGMLLAMISNNMANVRFSDIPVLSRRQPKSHSSDVPTPVHGPETRDLIEPRTRILSYDPFIAHIEGFLSREECARFLEISKPLLARSTVLYENGSRLLSDSRTSSTAYLPADDVLVASIMERASEFQGFLPLQTIDVQVTSYQPDQQYRAHYDWFLEPDRKTNRLSTFFAILEADCNDCGTQFPALPADWTKRDARWCEYMDCSQEILTTRNIVGSAIYWRNLDQNGKGRPDTLHAGLPAINGTKVGLNIWTEVEV